MEGQRACLLDCQFPQRHPSSLFTDLSEDQSTTFTLRMPLAALAYLLYFIIPVRKLGEGHSFDVTIQNITKDISIYSSTCFDLIYETKVC